MKTECECGATTFEPIRESHSLHLYAHTDKWIQCQNCGEILTRGIPEMHDEGMAFYLPDKNLKYERPECAAHGPMQPTKLWDDLDLQFKCPECYLITTEEPEDTS